MAHPAATPTAPPSARAIVSRCAFLLGCAAIVGCGSIFHTPPAGSSGLHQPKLPAGTAVVELFFVRLRGSDAELLNDIWPQLDEQSIEGETRARLAEHGFRLATTGAQMPPALQQLLQLRGETKDEPGTLTFDQENRVVMRRRHMHHNKPIELVASGVYESFPMMIRESGELVGKSFSLGQGVMSLKSSLTSDGGAKFVWTPLIQYGDARQTWGPGDGEFMIQSGRGKHFVDALRTTVTLRPGESLVFACRDEMSGSLGSYFFTQPKDGQVERKLIVLRLAQSQQDNEFAESSAPREP